MEVPFHHSKETSKNIFLFILINYIIDCDNKACHNNYAYNYFSSRDKRDFDVIRENHKFLWNEETDATDTWEKRLAKKYYDKLFKEYCICDMTFYKQNKVRCFGLSLKYLQNEFTKY